MKVKRRKFLQGALAAIALVRFPKEFDSRWAPRLQADEFAVAAWNTENKFWRLDGPLEIIADVQQKALTLTVESPIWQTTTINRLSLIDSQDRVLLIRSIADVHPISGDVLQASYTIRYSRPGGELLRSRELYSLMQQHRLLCTAENF